MATITLGVGDITQPYANDMYNLQLGSLTGGTFDDDYLRATYAYILYDAPPAPGQLPASYFGIFGTGFTYSQDAILSGVISALKEVEDGVLLYEVTGLSLDAAQFFNWIVTSNQEALRQSALAGDDIIHGGVNNDRLTGLGGHDTLYGGSGNDVLEGGAGDDWLDGGLGQDTADYSRANAGVDIDLQFASRQFASGAGADYLTSVENLIGSSHDDSLVGDSIANHLQGGAGSDTLVGMSGDDALDGGDGDDFLIGANPDATYSGQDRLTGGAGADFYIVDHGDRIAEFASDDDAVVFQTAHPVGRTMMITNGDGSREIRAYSADFSTYTSARIDSIAAGTRFNAEIYNGASGSGAVFTQGAVAKTAWDSIAYDGEAARLSVSQQFDQMLEDNFNFLAGLVSNAMSPVSSPSSTEANAPHDPDGPQGLLLVVGAVTLGIVIGLSVSYYRNKRTGNLDGFDRRYGPTIEAVGDAAARVLGFISLDPAGRYNEAVDQGKENRWLNFADSADGDASGNGPLGLAAGADSGAQAGIDILTYVAAQNAQAFRDAFAQQAAIDIQNLENAMQGRQQVRTNLDDDERLFQGGSQGLDGGLGDDIIFPTAFGPRGAPDPSAVGSPTEATSPVTLDGGAGIDTLSYAADVTGVTARLQTASAAGSASGAAIASVVVQGFENLHGGAGNDILRGNEGVNELLGGAGNDILESGGILDDADLLDGGAGFDTVSYAGDRAVYVDLADQTRNAYWARNDTLVNIERIVGSSRADVLLGDAADNIFDVGPNLSDNLSGEIIDGRAGNDTVSFEYVPFGYANYSRYGVVVSLQDGIARQHSAYNQVPILLRNVENVIGSAYQDGLIGDGQSNRLSGRDGGDELRGEGGNDVLEGGNGDDVLYGGAGDDILIGGEGADEYRGESGFDIAVIGGSSSLVLNFGMLSTSGVTVAGDRFYLGLEGIVGSSAADTFTGTNAREHLDGGDGWNIIRAGGGNDDLFGTGSLHGQAGDDRITGGGLADELDGGDGNDAIVGGGGDDRITGGPGADQLDGKDGVDTVDYSTDGGTRAVSVVLGATATDTWGTLDSLVSIENVIGTMFADTVVGDSGANRLEGRSGADSLFGQGGSDTLNGGDGADTLVGNADIFAQEADTLNGEAGDDLIYAERTDVLNGGSGRDSLIAVNSFDFTLNMTTSSIEYAVMDFGNDVITAAGQTVRVDVFAGGGNDSVTGSDFDDLIFGGAGNDTILGGLGADSIVGNEGVDSLNGGDGDDRVYFDAQDSFVSGGAGYDAGYITPGTGAGVVINLGAASIEFIQDLAGANDTLLGSTLGQGFSAFAGGGADTVDGSAFADILWGEAGDDTLNGNAGNDVAVGGAGADRLNGGAGNDALYGGAADGAADTFVFQHTGAANADAVYDFVLGQDKLDLSVFSSSFAGVGIVASGGSSVVYLNGQLICTVVGVVGLTAADFIMSASPAPADPGDGGKDAALTQPVMDDIVTSWVQPVIADEVVANTDGSDAFARPVWARGYASDGWLAVLV